LRNFEGILPEVGFCGKSVGTGTFLALLIQPGGRGKFINGRNPQTQAADDDEWSKNL
jgi:hypothetical protein